MSSPIHSARCVARDAMSVEIELAPTTACGAHFPISPFFALALLHECATGIVYASPGEVLRWAGEASPLARALTFDEILDLAGRPGDDVQKRATANVFIDEVAYVRWRNWTPGAGDLQATFDRAYEACLATADPSLRDRREDQLLPHATLRITVTEEQWLSHVAVGMMWDVYAFDDAATDLERARRVREPS